MIVSIIRVIIGIFTLFTSGWLITTIIDNIERGAKADKFLIFWAIYSFIVGVFMVITG